MNELIQSVESVFSKKENNALNSTFQYYYVPLYQRGYKWTKSQIEKLLIDINNFEYKSGKFYCVQNITLVPNPKGNCYNVVDGQQRLTTMTLILSILGENELVNGKLKFPSNSIRQYTNTFIQDWVIAGKKIPSDWEAFISSDANYDHQDIFHLFNGIHIINNWFDNNEIDKDAYKKKLLNHVKFICNKIEGEKEEKIFGNLNSKRVYLDGADLIRAILITRVTKENAEDESIKNVVRINERRVRIGWELDTVNQWWNQKEVQEYFSPFIQIAVSGEINFDFKKYPINQLFALYASFKNWESLSLERIEQVENTVQLYNELQKLHLELMDWYAHKEIYHYLGFLFHQSSSPKFGEVLNYYRHCKTKEEFTQYLLLTVKDVLFGEDNIEDIFNDNKDWYSEDSLTPTLLFLDIIEAIKDNRNRLHVSAFLKRENDIEHIHPQTPQNEKDKKGYLKFLIEKKEEILKDERVVNQKIESLDSEVLDAIIEDYKDKISTNSIGNLVLLYYRLNRSIQNNSYAYKRKRVLDYYNQGNYIQPHTLKVFSRYFQGEDSANTDGKFWTQDDIEENAKNIKSTLKNFFTKHINNEC